MNLAFFIRDYTKLPDTVHSSMPEPIARIQTDSSISWVSWMGWPHKCSHVHLLAPSCSEILSVHRRQKRSRVQAGILREMPYCKICWFPQQYVRNLTVEKATKIQGTDFSHGTRDLHDAMKAGKFPRRRPGVQLWEPTMLNSFDLDVLDAKKE